MPTPGKRSKYDDAGWHAGGDFPAELPYSQGGVHIAMFLAWILRRGLYNAEIFEPADVEMAQRQSVSVLGLLDQFDEKLVADELSKEGNAFAGYYYGFPDDLVVTPYLSDYDQTLGAGLPSLYHVAPTWENYAKLEPVMDGRYREWVASGRPAQRAAAPASPRANTVRNILAWIVGIVLFGLGALFVLAWVLSRLHP
ncbi:MAG: hypothetical protein M3Z28_09675 [Candidatus Dormibacteraeota bacterium]|nr:hypothetical protein [Candidatus Dormibacteraeota bacterium]